MGARVNIIGLAFWLAVLGAGTAFAQNTDNADNDGKTVIGEQERRMEQVYVNAPEIFVYGTGFTPADVQSGAGYLSQDKLELVAVSEFSESAEGICYYVLLDISGSIPNAYFQKTKEGIQNLQDCLGEKDKLVLCTFGEDVVLAADGSQTPEALMTVLEGLKNKDQKTLLFEGIDRVAALSEQKKMQDCRRSVLVVISDGEDIAVGKKLAQEAQSTLREKGIPAYAFCIKDTATANINNFGEFARTSGGYLVTFTPAEGSQMLCELAANLQNDICIEYRASSNIVTNKEESFSLKFADDSVLTKAVMNVRWIPDMIPPSLISGEAIGNQQIHLKFSEPMIGLDGAANYQVIFEGKTIGVTGVSFDKENSDGVTLSLAEPVRNGTYEIIGTNITDYSMEKNPLAGSLTVEITEGEQETSPESTQPEPPLSDSPPPFDYAGVLFLVFAAIVALTIVILVKIRKKPADEKEAVKPPAEIPLQAAGKRLDVVISMDQMQPQRAVWEIKKNLIVGRSSACDVSFDDVELSRQHFCLSLEDGNLYIADLKSLNGTTVNGSQLQEKKRLDPGAMIEAGSMKIIVRW